MRAQAQVFGPVEITDEARLDALIAKAIKDRYFFFAKDGKPHAHKKHWEELQQTFPEIAEEIRGCGSAPSLKAHITNTNGH